MTDTVKTATGNTDPGKTATEIHGHDEPHVHGPNCNHDHDHHGHHHGHHHHAPVEQFVRASPKVGRNDPCPCGSGKKHKKCCLAA